MTKRAPRQTGFSLVELMVVVAIVAVLAAIAIPTFQKYLAKTKIAEAPPTLRRIVDGATAYFNIDHADRNGVLVEPQFPVTTGWYPAELPVGRKVLAGPDEPPAADRPTWEALKVALGDPVYFHYRFRSQGSGLNQQAVAEAEGTIMPPTLCTMRRDIWTKDGSSHELVYSDLKIITPPY